MRSTYLGRTATCHGRLAAQPLCRPRAARRTDRIARMAMVGRCPIGALSAVEEMRSGISSPRRQGRLRGIPPAHISRAASCGNDVAQRGVQRRLVVPGTPPILPDIPPKMYYSPFPRPDKTKNQFPETIEHWKVHSVSAGLEAFYFGHVQFPAPSFKTCSSRDT